jgi:hypothetical protein
LNFFKFSSILNSELTLRKMPIILRKVSSETNKRKKMKITKLPSLIFAILFVFTISFSFSSLWSDAEQDRLDERKRQDEKILEKKQEDDRLQKARINQQVEEESLSRQREDDARLNKRLDDERWDREHGR